MSIQPLSNSSPAVEPAVQRRRAAERDPGAERESFVLPREETVHDASSPVREGTRATARDVNETRRTADETTGPSEEASDTAAKPAAQQAPSATGAKAPETTTGKPGGKVVAVAPATQVAAPNPDIGALVSIAVAAQAEVQPAKTGKTGEAADEKLAGQKTEGEAGATVAEPKAEGAGLVGAPASQPVVFVPLVPVPTLPLEQAAAPAATAAGDGDLLSGKARPAMAAAALSPVPARETLSEPAPDPATSTVTTAGVAPAPAAKHGVPLSSSETLPLLSDGGQAATPETAQVATEKAASTQAQVQPQGPASVQASAPADFKPIEALQQALNPIDLSALGQQAGARPEPLRIMATPELLAAQTPATTLAHAAADSQPTPLHVLPIEIGLRALAGARQFDIRLDPGELGRVDVNLSISDNGEVSAKMVVDRVETLHLLQRDARTLERAFEQAGLKPSDAGVDITLRDPSDQPGFRQNRQQDEAPQRARILANASEAGDDNPISTQTTPVRRFVRLGGVDLSV